VGIPVETAEAFPEMKISRVWALVSAVAVMVLVGCGGNGEAGVVSATDAPSFSPPGGTYSTAQSVTISDATVGAAIYYTVNGSTPTTSSTLYSGPIAVGSTEAIEAFAVVQGSASSSVVSATYSIVPPVLPAPLFSVPGGSYSAAQSVGLSDAVGTAAIYYTTNSTTPTTGSTLYSGPITVSAAETIEAIAVATGYTNSAVASASYTFPASGDWTWVSGSNTINSAGSYGTVGMESASNAPPARFYGMSWVDGSGMLWLYGGEPTPPGGTYDDLWRFDPATQEWAWMGGSQTLSLPAVYGTVGVAAASNSPGARSGAETWVDSEGNLWMFGGAIPDTAVSIVNDLWMFNVTTDQWTWMGGSTSPNVQGVYGTVGISAASNAPGSRQLSSCWVDGSGDLWMFGGYGYGSTAGYAYLNDLWKYNIATNEWTWVGGANTTNSTGSYGVLGVASSGNVPGSRGATAQWSDSNGNFWLLGGSIGPGSSTDLENDLWRYNVSSNEWTWEGGSNQVEQPGVYGTLGVPSSSNVPGSRYTLASWQDQAGNLWLFGGGGFGSNATSNGLFLDDLWEYNVTSNEWAWKSGSTSQDTPGTYGTLGTPAAANTPGARQAPVSWVDKSGNLWLFGGYGYTNGTFSTLGVYNDLWRYEP
jgi:N-acetylneuraminic acid mutarotase